MTQPQKFLGRTLNRDTMMWEFADKSGVAIPEEIRQGMLTDIECSKLPSPHNKGHSAQALGRLFKYKDEHKIKE